MTVHPLDVVAILVVTVAAVYGSLMTALWIGFDPGRAAEFTRSAVIPVLLVSAAACAVGWSVWWLL